LGAGAVWPTVDTRNIRCTDGKPEMPTSTPSSQGRPFPAQALPAITLLPGQARAARAARQFVTAGCRDLTGDQAATVALLVSELFTNALAYALPGPVMIAITHPRPDAMRVTVTDRGGGQTIPCACSQPDPGMARGRGLLLVRSLASCWGISIAAGWCAVWFEMGTPPAPPADLQLAGIGQAQLPAAC